MFSKESEYAKQKYLLRKKRSEKIIKLILVLLNIMVINIFINVLIVFDI